MGKLTKSPSSILFALSVVAFIITVYVTLTNNDVFKIAGTQWILVAILLAVYAQYLNTCCKIDKNE